HLRTGLRTRRQHETHDVGRFGASGDRLDVGHTLEQPFAEREPGGQRKRGRGLAVTQPAIVRDETRGRVLRLGRRPHQRVATDARHLHEQGRFVDQFAGNAPGPVGAEAHRGDTDRAWHALGAHRACASSRRTDTRTMSEPEPVASVSSRLIAATVFKLGARSSFAYGVAQWSNCPIISSASGRRPAARIAGPRGALTCDAISSSSLSRMPSERAVSRLMTMPWCPRTLRAASCICGIETLPLAWNCMLLVVSSQNGNSAGSRPACTIAFSQRFGTSSHAGRNWYSASCSSHQCSPCSCRRLASSSPERISRSWYGSSKRSPWWTIAGYRYQPRCEYGRA